MSFQPNECNKVQFYYTNEIFYPTLIALPALLVCNLSSMVGQEKSGFVSHCLGLNDVGQPDPQQIALSTLMCCELAMLVPKYTVDQFLVP